MPEVQGTVGNTVEVESCGTEVTVFVIANARMPMPAIAIVPAISLDRGDRVALYDGEEVLLFVNDEKVPVGRWYNLGSAGVSLAIGWNYPHVLPRLATKLGCGD